MSSRTLLFSLCTLQIAHTHTETLSQIRALKRTDNECFLNVCSRQRKTRRRRGWCQRQSQGWHAIISFFVAPQLFGGHFFFGAAPETKDDKSGESGWVEWIEGGAGRGLGEFGDRICFWSSLDECQKKKNGSKDIFLAGKKRINILHLMPTRAWVQANILLLPPARQEKATFVFRLGGTWRKWLECQIIGCLVNSMCLPFTRKSHGKSWSLYSSTCFSTWPFLTVH